MIVKEEGKERMNKEMKGENSEEEKEEKMKAK